MLKNKSYLIVFALFLCTFGMYGQHQRKLLYETSTKKTFNLSCWTHISSLSDLDMVSLEEKPELIKQAEYVINQDNLLAITHTYPQQPRWERDYEFQMGKSVTDAWGTTLYDHHGVELYHSPYEDEYGGNFYEGFLLYPEVISTYGVFNELFHPDNLTKLLIMIASGEIVVHDVYNVGSTLLMVQTQTGEYGEVILVETEIDFEQLYLETRVYVDNVHDLTERTEYQHAGGGIIPRTKQMISYNELPSGIPYRITETDTYLSYKVFDENENVLVGYDQSFAFEINPNPADDHITLHFETPINDGVHIQVIGPIGYAHVYDYYDYVLGDEHVIQICHLEPGRYIVVCNFDDGTRMHSYFVKDDGAGQQPINFAIQTFPNITQDYINVRFSTEMDTGVQIFIVDMTGTLHLQYHEYVQNNSIHQFDVSALPQDVYYIICINTNDSTAVEATFFKR